MIKITIEAEGHDDDMSPGDQLLDAIFGVKEAVRRIEAGHTSGHDRNSSSRFTFNVEETS